MKKSEIQATQWLETKEVPIGKHSVTIRELSAAKRNEIRTEYSKIQGADGDDKANDYLIRSYCFSSVVDEDGLIVYETTDEQSQALEQLSDKWFVEVFREVSSLNNMGLTTDEDIEKKSALSTEAQITSSGSEDSAESLDIPVSEECLMT